APSGVPIIAPPPDHGARLPLTAEAAAKIRIANLLAREACVRGADELNGIEPVGAGEEEEARQAERLKWEHTLAVGPELRASVVGWLLEVLPDKYMYSNTPHRSASLESSASSVYSACGYEEGRPDFIDQLLTSPETRFHAAYMFARYFYLFMGEKIERSQREATAAEDKAGDEMARDGWPLVVWDVCLACLAISIKMHRDVLEPLSPVLSWEFEAIAPHELSYTDLELAQRDVLAAFHYSLGCTPQPILDELWTALPSLRQLLEFRGGWIHAQKEAWYLLFDAVGEPDILTFPVSLLTAAALTEALVTVLVCKFKYDAATNGRVFRRRPRESQPGAKKLEERLVERAWREIEGVVQDVQAVIGVSDERLKACQRWLCAVA
ncbi:hypothetical protein DFH07DRAFT_540215, partial [Mycena maculata]